MLRNSSDYSRIKISALYQIFGLSLLVRVSSVLLLCIEIFSYCCTEVHLDQIGKWGKAQVTYCGLNSIKIIKYLYLLVKQNCKFPLFLKMFRGFNILSHSISK